MYRVLLVGGHLGEGAAAALVGDEDRVVAETRRASWRRGRWCPPRCRRRKKKRDPLIIDCGRDQRHGAEPGRRCRVSVAPTAASSSKEPSHVVGCRWRPRRRKGGRAHPRSPAQRVHLEAGVVGHGGGTGRRGRWRWPSAGRCPPACPRRPRPRRARQRGGARARPAAVEDGGHLGDLGPVLALALTTRRGSGNGHAARVVGHSAGVGGSMSCSDAAVGQVEQAIAQLVAAEGHPLGGALHLDEAGPSPVITTFSTSTSAPVWSST